MLVLWVPLLLVLDVLSTATFVAVAQIFHVDTARGDAPHHSLAVVARVLLRHPWLTPTYQSVGVLRALRESLLIARCPLLGVRMAVRVGFRAPILPGWRRAASLIVISAALGVEMARLRGTILSFTAALSSLVVTAALEIFLQGADRVHVRLGENPAEDLLPIMETELSATLWGLAIPVHLQALGKVEDRRLAHIDASADLVDECMQNAHALARAGYERDLWTLG